MGNQKYNSGFKILAFPCSEQSNLDSSPFMAKHRRIFTSQFKRDGLQKRTVVENKAKVLAL